MAVLVDLPSGEDPQQVERAFDRVVLDCDALRMLFVEQGGEAVRKVVDGVCAPLEHVDLSNETEPETAVLQWAERRARRVLRLDECLYDAVLIRLAEGRLKFFLNQHHIITDGLSSAVVIGHLARCLAAVKSGTVDDVAPLPSFLDYLEYVQVSASSREVTEAREYWKTRLSGAGEPPKPYGVVAGRTVTDSIRVLTDLGQERTASLREIASGEARMLTEHLSMFNIFATLVIAFVHRISGVHDVVIGTPGNNRPTAVFRKTAGLLAEVFPLRTDIAPDETFASLLKKVQKETFDFLKAARPGASSLELHSHLNVILNYITAAFPPMNGSSPRSRWVHPDAADANHALRVQVHDYDNTGSFGFFFDFNTAVFDRDLRPLAVQHFFELIDAFIEDRSTRLGDVLRSALSPLPADVAESAAGHDRPASRGAANFLDLFGRVVEHSGEQIALESAEESISYAELDARADRVAGLLLDRGLAVDQPVALCLPRSVDFVVAMLGVMKAGGLFCPVSPNAPQARTDQMLSDLGDPITLTGRDLITLPDHGPGPASTEVGDLAYVLYTSGSTGRPKGVTISHRALLNYVQWASSTYVGGRRATWPLFTATTFDLTLTSLLVPLASGGRILVFPETDDPADTAVLDVFADDRVDVVKLTPAHLDAIKMLDLGSSRIRTLIVGGERLPQGLALRILSDMPGPVDLYNEYGPTEATVGCVVHKFDPDCDHSESVPIGIPIEGAEAYVLDSFLHEVPTGGVGELYLGGICLAEGYWGDPQQTASRFIVHPESGQRLYVTGDRVRILPDGILEYLGRTDDQLKIRGFRIEPAEI
jgi:amino acid adenylation domain-containing protein